MEDEKDLVLGKQSNKEIKKISHTHLQNKNEPYVWVF